MTRTLARTVIGSATITLEWKPADTWIGAFWRTGDNAGRRVIHVWLCLVPCLPIHIAVTLRWPRCAGCRLRLSWRISENGKYWCASCAPHRPVSHRPVSHCAICNAPLPATRHHFYFCNPCGAEFDRHTGGHDPYGWAAI